MSSFAVDPAAPGSRRFGQPKLIVLRAEPPMQPLRVVVEHRLTESRLVEDALEDLLVLVHAPHAISDSSGLISSVREASVAQHARREEIDEALAPAGALDDQDA